jgi:dihydroxyacetone kinase-like protein
MTLADAAMSSPMLIGALIDDCCSVIDANVERLDSLDAAIGDGDHGTNMRRGAAAVLAEREAIANLPVGEALGAAGRAAVMSIGGAAGPLYGTLLIELGKQFPAEPKRADVARAVSDAVDAVARRGRSEAGCKTLLDVLCPLRDAMLDGTPLAAIARDASRWAEATKNMRALRGRASFLGARSVGHVDPGAASASLLVATICRRLRDPFR